MTNEDAVSVLKHLDDKIGILFAAHRDLHNAEDTARKTALDISIREIERRLDGLNHESSRLVAMQKTYMPRESFEIQHEEFRREIDALRIFEANIRGQVVAYASVISIVIGVVLFVVGRLWQ